MDSILALANAEGDQAAPKEAAHHVQSEANQLLQERHILTQFSHAAFLAVGAEDNLRFIAVLETLQLLKVVEGLFDLGLLHCSLADLTQLHLFLVSVHVASLRFAGELAALAVWIS